MCSGLSVFRSQCVQVSVCSGLSVFRSQSAGWSLSVSQLFTLGAAAAEAVSERKEEQRAELPPGETVKHVERVQSCCCCFTTQ